MVEGMCWEGSRGRLEARETGGWCATQVSQYGHCGGIGPGGGAQGRLYQDGSGGGAICGYVLNPVCSGSHMELGR